MLVLGALLVAGIVVTIWWGGTAYEPWEPAAGEGPPSGRPSPKAAVLRYLRGGGVALVGGFWAGILVTGPAIRLIMRLLAATAGDGAQGAGSPRRRRWSARSASAARSASCSSAESSPVCSAGPSSSSYGVGCRADASAGLRSAFCTWWSPPPGSIPCGPTIPTSTSWARAGSRWSRSVWPRSCTAWPSSPSPTATARRSRQRRRTMRSGPASVAPLALPALLLMFPGEIQLMLPLLAGLAITLIGSQVGPLVRALREPDGARRRSHAPLAMLFVAFLPAAVLDLRDVVGQAGRRRQPAATERGRCRGPRPIRPCRRRSWPPALDAPSPGVGPLGRLEPLDVLLAVGVRQPLEPGPASGWAAKAVARSSGMSTVRSSVSRSTVTRTRHPGRYQPRPAPPWSGRGRTGRRRWASSDRGRGRR